METLQLRTLGPEADVLSALAAAHGAAGSMALAIGRRLIERGGGRHLIRQGRALSRLANALADAFNHSRGGNLDEVILDRIVTALAAAGRAERRGLQHSRLLTLPPGWTGPLRMTGPDLALVGVTRLRQALERHALAGGNPKRLVQLQAIKQLEVEVRGIRADLAAHKLDARASLCAVVARFAAAEAIIGEDLATLFAAPAPGTTILTAAYGRHAAA